jgi:hypothetical protein
MTRPQSTTPHSSDQAMTPRVPILRVAATLTIVSQRHL